MLEQLRLVADLVVVDILLLVPPERLTKVLLVQLVIRVVHITVLVEAAEQAALDLQTLPPRQRVMAVPVLLLP